MTLLQLEYCIALAENLHYTKTAELLHISQPSLSYEIKELEKELGAELFVIRNKKVYISEYGTLFLPYAKKALSTLSKGTQAVHDRLSNSEYTVRLGYFHSIAASFIPSMVDSFKTAFPDSRITFSFEEIPARDIPDRIKQDKIDLGFSLLTNGIEDNYRIRKQPLCLYVPSGHRLSKKSRVTLTDLENEPFIMLTRSNSLRDFIEKRFADEDIIPDTAFEVPECNTALQYVSMGYGISVLPPLHTFNAEKVHSIPIMEYDRELSREIFLLCGKSVTKGSPAAAVRDFITAHYLE